MLVNAPHFTCPPQHIQYAPGGNTWKGPPCLSFILPPLRFLTSQGACFFSASQTWLAPWDACGGHPAANRCSSRSLCSLCPGCLQPCLAGSKACKGKTGQMLTEVGTPFGPLLLSALKWTTAAEAGTSLQSNVSSLGDLVL